jgi:hypothetical protein
MVAAWPFAYAVTFTPPTVTTLTLKPVHSSDSVISRSQVFDHTFLELRTHLREIHDLEQEITAEVERNQTINTTELPT